jgi:hypothetical protein
MLSGVKVLAVCVPVAGHVTPLLPLLRSMVDSGDEVVVATGEAVADAVTKSGARVHPVPGGLDDWFGRLGSRIKGAPGDGLPPDRIEHYFVPRLFAEIVTDAMIDEVLAAGTALRPDLVVFDTEAFAGPLAADVLGVPAVHHSIGSLLAPEVVELAADAVSPLWRSFDRQPRRDAGLYQGVTLTICPSSLAPDRVPGDSLALRPTVLPRRPRRSAARPLVYVTLGTLWSDPAVFRAVLEAMADEPVDVVATVGGDQDPAALGAVPANARVERFIPQAELLPDCAVVVHHAGAGTMFGALAHGLPQLALPQAADNFTNAEMLHRSGAGRTLMPAEVSPETVRLAVKTLLEEPSCSVAAGKIASEIAAMPSPEEVAAELRRRHG